MGKATATARRAYSFIVVVSKPSEFILKWGVGVKYDTSTYGKYLLKRRHLIEMQN
jgi:hypothetical protein